MACFSAEAFKERRKRSSRRFGEDRSGTAAVEFAIIAPVFLMMVLGMLAFGIYLGAAHSVRQLVSDVARATISGATEQERQLIATNFIAVNVDNYAFIEIEDLEISVRDSESVPNQFVVEISYDASELPIWGFSKFVPAPSKTITATAAIVNGGFVQ